MKRCCGCKTEKPFDAFGRHRGSKDGFQTYCLECARRYGEKYKARHPGRKANLARSNNLKQKYSLTVAEYEAMLVDQNWGCAVCGLTLGEGQAAHVDHCHVTGRVRGLLCRNCNGAMGMLMDDAEVVAKMLHYLQTR